MEELEKRIRILSSTISKLKRKSKHQELIIRKLTKEIQEYKEQKHKKQRYTNRRR